MKQHDPSKPLIVIHIPKAGGTSSQEFFRKWYGCGFIRHYFDEQASKLPPKYDLDGMHSVDRPILLHGHFNRLRQFGIEDYYPNTKQFITILRDPLELTISHYYYTRANGRGWKDKSRIPDRDLSKHLQTAKPNMLNHFPRVVTKDNYREIIEKYFIEVGITEHLNETMKRIATKLDKPFHANLLSHLNSTNRDQRIPSNAKDDFRENHQLEYIVYDYAIKKFQL